MTPAAEMNTKNIGGVSEGFSKAMGNTSENQLEKKRFEI